jgi:molybdopterin converting factor small subunit
MMRVVFLGRLRDVAGKSERTIEAPPSIAAYLKGLAQHEPDLHAALIETGVRQALNLTLLPVGQNEKLKAGDELAFMPPFSGG